MILILNFTRPHTITYTNCHFAGHFAVGNGNATTEVTVLIGTTAFVLQIIQVKKNLHRYWVHIAKILRAYFKFGVHDDKGYQVRGSRLLLSTRQL